MKLYLKIRKVYQYIYYRSLLNYLKYDGIGLGAGYFSMGYSLTMTNLIFLWALNKLISSLFNVPEFSDYIVANIIVGILLVAFIIHVTFKADLETLKKQFGNGHANPSQWKWRGYMVVFYYMIFILSGIYYLYG